MSPWLVALAPLIAGCSASAAGQEEYRPLPLPDEIFSVPQGVFTASLADFPENREGRQEFELTVTEQDDGSNIVLLTRSGFLDDSVSGDQQRAILVPSADGWRVTALGERWRCQGGRGPWGWTTSPCN